MKRYTKADIDFHDGKPAVNVKVYQPFGGRGAADRLMDMYGVSEGDAERALETAFQIAQSDFWDALAEYALDRLRPSFSDSLKVYSEGRSGGWLVVYRYGRPIADRDDVDGWDAIQVSAWGRFERQIDAEIAYLCQWDQVLETIQANDLLTPQHLGDGAVYYTHR